MRRAGLAALLLLGALGCGGLFGPPEVELANVRGTPCATIEGTLTTKAWKADRAVRLTIDRVVVAPVPVPAGEALGSFERSVGPGRHVLVVDGSPDRAVEVPPVEAALDWAGWARTPREGDPARLTLRFVGACPIEAFSVTAEVSGRSLARRQPLVGSGVELDLSGLPAGSHALEVTLHRGDLVVDRRTLQVPIDPPCAGPKCKDRDNDGFAGARHGGKDCDDEDPAVHPGAVAFPDPDGDGAVVATELDLDCDGEVEVFEGSRDCAEGDPRVPRPEEPVPTGVDEDCDGLVDEGTVVFDDDGDGYSEEKGDCRDDDPAVSPRAKESPDCKDNDCDGQVDDGVTRPTDEDPYEPNDTRAFALEGAQKMGGPFGGYRTTRDELTVRIRGEGDAETFQLFAHDGNLDEFHVTVTAASIGDGLAYEATVEGPSGRVNGRLDANGASLTAPSRGFSNDTGSYTITVRPLGAAPPHCPVSLVITSG